MQDLTEESLERVASEALASGRALFFWSPSHRDQVRTWLEQAHVGAGHLTVIDQLWLARRRVEAPVSGSMR